MRPESLRCQLAVDEPPPRSVSTALLPEQRRVGLALVWCRPRAALPRPGVASGRARMESSWTWSSNCPLPPSPRAPRTWPRGLGQDRPCSKGPGGAGLTSESTSPHLEPRSGCQRASGGQRPALTVLVARKGSGSTVSQPAGGAGPGQRGVTRAGRPESGAPGQRPESDGGGAGPRGARGGAAAAHRPVPGHHGAGLLARRPGAGGGRVRTLLPPLPVRRSLRPGRGAARLRAFRARLPPDGRR